MNRRHAMLVALGGLVTSGGCDRTPAPPAAADAGAPEPPSPPSSGDQPLPEGASLVPVDIDPSMEIRTVVGLRPFRPSGFVVRREEREGRVLIHNYGHGGGGVTLSWGSSHLAVNLAESVSGRSCGVIGGGVMGLSTARLLQLRGAKVTLYTRDLPPETTSNIAGAQWWPVSVFDSSRRTEEFGAQFVEAAQFSHRYFQQFTGPEWGVRWLPNYYLSDDPPLNGWMGGPGGVLHHLQVGIRDFGPGEHVFPTRYVRRFHSMLIEPAVYLASLLREVQGAGAEIVVRQFRTAAEILSLPHPFVFNCTGLGARDLFDDPELVPIRGQLTALVPQPAVGYNLIRDNIYMFPRSDGILLGGTYERGSYDLAPDPASKERILAAHRSLFTAMSRTLEGLQGGRAPLAE